MSTSDHNTRMLIAVVQAFINHHRYPEICGLPDLGKAEAAWRAANTATVEQHAKPETARPLHRDEDGTIRFRKNAIVRHLLDAGPIDLNQLAIMDFSQEDWDQFYQLIGYSLSGYGDLNVSDEAYDAAAHAAADLPIDNGKQI